MFNLIFAQLEALIPAFFVIIPDVRVPVFEMIRATSIFDCKAPKTNSSSSVSRLGAIFETIGARFALLLWVSSESLEENCCPKVGVLSSCSANTDHYSICLVYSEINLVQNFHILSNNDISEDDKVKYVLRPKSFNDCLNEMGPILKTAFLFRRNDLRRKQCLDNRDMLNGRACPKVIF